MTQEAHAAVLLIIAHDAGQHLHIKSNECKLCLEEAYHQFMEQTLTPVNIGDVQ